MLSWFDASDAREFGKLLAYQVMEKLPLDVTKGKGKKLIKKHESLTDKMSLEIARYKEKHALNIYKKAKLGNSFKWTLRDVGYDFEYVDQCTNWLMVRI